MNSRKSLTIVLAALLIALILPAAAMAATAVSVECAYDNPASTDLVCQIVVDTTEILRSGGVLVNYDPDILTYVSATKDPAWKFTGPGAPADGYPYMNPELGAGSVLFIVGMLDTNDTDLGITGRAKVGEIIFTRNATPAPGTLGPAQAAFFGISGGLGRPDPFVNFVNTSGVNLDAPLPSFSAIAAERGDANADALINVGDFTATRGYLSSPSPPPYADCNNDGLVNVGDFTCIRSKL